MKVNLYKNIDGIPIYIDNYMEDHQVLKGIKGNDLKYYLDLSYPEMVLGCEKEVPIIEGGKIKIDIVELSRPNAILRIKNKGMVSVETGVRGDLHIMLGIKIPDSITTKEKSLLVELKNIVK